jgi:hypothetical protein
MTDEGRGEARGLPDSGDENLWREFNEHLWRMVNEDGPSEAGAGLPPPYESFEEEADAAAPVSPANLRKDDCLTFERYQVVASEPSALTSAERLHLEACRHCERHVAAFAAQAPRAATPEVTAAAVTHRTNWRERIAGRLRARGALSDFAPLLRATPAWAAVTAFVIVAALGAFLLFKSGLLRANETASSPSVAVPKQSQDVRSPTPPNAPDDKAPRERAGALQADSSPAPPKGATGVLKPKVIPRKASEKPAPSNEERAVHTPYDSNVVGPPAEKAAVVASLRAGRIVTAGSEFESIERVGTRSAGGGEVTPLYPKNEATLETNPTFRWRGAEGLEYRIIVSYLDGSEVESSRVLSGESGRLERDLAPGTYFWRVAARRKGGREEVVPGYVIFKVLSEAERRRVEAAAGSSKSNLVRAILYARAGLLGKAEAELDKRPRSPKANRMLSQVRSWRQK